MQSGFKRELDFLKTAERLKMELRHSWLSNRRRESVAEHSWRLSLMVLRYANKLDRPLKVELALKLAIIHDLAEVEVGDIPVFNCQTSNSKRAKFIQEQQAMLNIKETLEDRDGEELYQLWLEYELQETYESRVVKALDKLEAFIQHNEAPFDTWEDREKRMIFQHKWLIDYCQFDSFLQGLCTATLNYSIQRMQEAGEDITLIKQQAREEEQKWDLSHT